jgi:hypothetical protein
MHIVVYLRNRTFSRAVGLSGVVSNTLLTSKAPDASKFRVFGCIVFAKVPHKLRRKRGEKTFSGVLVGYLFDAPWYRVYNPVTRPITASVHAAFQKDVPCFGVSTPIDSLITDAAVTDSDYDNVHQSHRLDLDTHDADDAPR